MIHAQVRSENGDVLSRGSHGLDWSATLQYIDEDEFPFLGGLLPYGDTMFNYRQVEKLQREVNDETVLGILGQSVAAEIESLCLQVRNGLHLYLWFLGD